MKSLFLLLLCPIGYQAKDTFAKDPPRSGRIDNDRPSGSSHGNRPSHLSGTPSDYVDYGKYKYPLSRASYPQTKLVGPGKIPSHRPSGSQHGNRPSHQSGTPNEIFDYSEDLHTALKMDDIKKAPCGQAPLCSSESNMSNHVRMSFVLLITVANQKI